MNRSDFRKIAGAAAQIRTVRADQTRALYKLAAASRVIRKHAAADHMRKLGRASAAIRRIKTAKTSSETNQWPELPKDWYKPKFKSPIFMGGGIAGALIGAAMARSPWLGALLGSMIGSYGLYHGLAVFDQLTGEGETVKEDAGVSNAAVAAEDKKQKEQRVQASSAAGTPQEKPASEQEEDVELSDEDISNLEADLDSEIEPIADETQDSVQASEAAQPAATTPAAQPAATTPAAQPAAPAAPAAQPAATTPAAQPAAPAAPGPDSVQVPAPAPAPSDNASAFSSGRDALQRGRTVFANYRPTGYLPYKRASLSEVATFVGLPLGGMALGDIAGIGLGDVLARRGDAETRDRLQRIGRLYGSTGGLLLGLLAAQKVREP